MTKAQFGLHIWIGIFLCLFSVSCSDDDTDSIKGDDDDFFYSIGFFYQMFQTEAWLRLSGNMVAKIGRAHV